ncbi:glutathione S-transferase family protein [Pseudooceanicola sp. HF7]|uniref:glutathione S-transferase family protein n=1 Tax=Pseudooceanicola sp. HF7 TaxID=2721560 RepID=UPI00143128E8|nr:glutathione S-transferase family protein [Pseudooceanicola sp. HF7]NIZ10713.1 glutathione S-transferase family protein [Pseudooceanicola sp. HF7]
MGLLVDGKWVDKWYDTEKSGGAFERQASQFRNWVTADGSAGPSGDAGFKAESGRYHLYVSYACPWAHRALIFRALKGLGDHISVSVVHPHMLDEGWTFDTDFDGSTGDTLFGLDYLREIYLKAQPDASTRVTVPVLWDKKTGTIVSNESAEIIRMFNSAFNDITGDSTDYYPEELHDDIEALNDRIYDTVNNGVYKCGFATSQKAYDAAITPLFDSLDWIEDILQRNRYLAGSRLTEADWRLFTTLIRFDKVYHSHFKTNLKRVVDYPAIWGYVRELYQWPGVAETVHFDHICHHYYYSHDTINPHRIVPITAELALDSSHGRSELPAES